MMIGMSEGQGWRYEVVDAAAGFLVRMRDLDTGEIEDGESTLFRTATVAFAYAELSAAFDRYAGALMADDEAGDWLLAELQSQRDLFDDLSRRLGDAGLAAHLLVAWEREESVRDRPTLH